MKNAIGLQIIDQVIREYPKMKVNKDSLILRIVHIILSLITNDFFYI